MPMDVSYILPIHTSRSAVGDELNGYLCWLADRVEVIVVDGSSPEVFDAHDQAWSGWVRHLPPDPDLVTPMGKVGGVLTGLRHASCDRVIFADDDVRYDEPGLRRMADALTRADVVRPQNFFRPLPWHAYLDTARSLLNRMTGGDWPGTLGVRRSILLATGGYAGDVMFENLELIRTVKAAGGTEAVPLDLFVLRHPPTTRHFWSQRIRQAYDELARPVRLAAFLALLPIAFALAYRRRWSVLGLGAAGTIGLAEAGRRREGGAMVFPAAAALLAPLWVAERAVSSWLAVGAHLLCGGIPYRETVLSRAATPKRELRRRYARLRTLNPEAPRQSV